jgi:hypothetical protein
MEGTMEAYLVLPSVLKELSGLVSREDTGLVYPTTQDRRTSTQRVEEDEAKKEDRENEKMSSDLVASLGSCLQV